LDVGCFTGDLIKLLLAKGADAYGLELQSDAVRLAERDLPGRVFQADVHGTTFPPGPYEAITIMQVIEHVIDPAELLRRARSLLVPNGRLLLQTPDSSSIIAYATASHWPLLAPVEHIHLFSREAMRRLLHACGFTNVQFRRHIKRLPVGYVYEMLSNYGPEWRRLFRPIHLLFGDTVLPFYVGEMFVSAVRDANNP